jgi:carbonic anhydrase
LSTKTISILAALLVAASTHAADTAHWTYSGHAGAKHWGDMSPDFATCKLGRVQSPIDIRGAAKAAAPVPIGFEYTDSAAEVVNNGHTIQVNLEAGGSVKLASGAYRLLQLHFHTPSEEKIRGRSFPLVAHLVHRNDAGRLAVVAVLFKTGRENPALARVFAAMPAKGGDKATMKDGFNAAGLLPTEQGYYAFKGSLTTPPCSEDVQWQVLKVPVELSRSQLNAFRKFYPMNARPVQPLNGRKVEENG